MGRSYWLAVAAYLLPTFPLGYFWHLRTFRRQYEELKVYRSDMIIPLGLLSMFSQALLFAWIYPRLFSTARSDWLQSAASFGVVFGLLAFTFATLPAAAKYPMTSARRFMALESTFTALHVFVVAPLVALAWRAPS